MPGPGEFPAKGTCFITWENNPVFGCISPRAQLQQSQENAVTSTRDSEEGSSSPNDRLDPALATLQVDKTKTRNCEIVHGLRYVQLSLFTPYPNLISLVPRSGTARTVRNND